MTKTYAQIAREIAALQATADKLYAAEIKSVVTKMNEVIEKYSLTPDDLVFRGGSSNKPSAIEKALKVATRPAATTVGNAKYSDGQGRVWGGRGPRPAWLRDALADGLPLESFLTGGATASPVATAQPRSNAATTANAKPVAVSVPKYRDPKTGATWSGRGPRPQWLKDALRKRGRAIGDFAIGAAVPI